MDTTFFASTSLTDSFGNPVQVSFLALQTNGQIVLAGLNLGVADQPHLVDLVVSENSDRCVFARRSMI